MNGYLHSLALFDLISCHALVLLDILPKGTYQVSCNKRHRKPFSSNLIFSPSYSTIFSCHSCQTIRNQQVISLFPHQVSLFHYVAKCCQVEGSCLFELFGKFGKFCLAKILKNPCQIWKLLATLSIFTPCKKTHLKVLTTF